MSQSNLPKVGINTSTLIQRAQEILRTHNITNAEVHEAPIMIDDEFKDGLVIQIPSGSPDLYAILSAVIVGRELNCPVRGEMSEEST